MTSYKPVQSVEKALLLLEVLNRRPVSRVKDLAAATGLPHPTVIRLLETLVAVGYAVRSDRGAGYCVTEKTAQLSSGNHGFPAMLTSLRASADWLTETLLWPAAICTLDGDAMVVRYSTIPKSPLSHIHSTINLRLCLIRRAHGRAYLAFCPDAERAHLLDILESLPTTPADFSRDAFCQDLEAVRIGGFAIRAKSLRNDTNSVAVPCWWQGRLVATLGLTFFSRSVPDPAKLVEALKRASAGSLPSAAERAGRQG